MRIFALPTALRPCPPAQPARGRGGPARRGRARQARPGARAGGAGLRRVSDALRPRRPIPSRAPRRGRGRPAGAAGSRKSCAARRCAQGFGGARPAGPGRRRRGRGHGDGVARRRRAARDLGRRRRAGQKPELAGPGAAPRRRDCFAPRLGEGRRPLLGEAGWGKLAALAYAWAALAALDLAQDLSRRADRLTDAAPKLRAKGKGRALEAPLAEHGDYHSDALKIQTRSFASRMRRCGAAWLTRAAGRALSE